MMNATYSPEDNKLRLYPAHRLSAEDYARVKALGFIWAPKQELFVAPMWTPEREDLLIEWCGEVEDEDKSLAERAEERAERFAEYGDKRKADAERAHEGVNRICEHIPLGQPILVGHHSEKHARKDAERIQNGMRRAVQMWETAGYWQARAAGALQHAKYKELPRVRLNRIKKLEAEMRKMLRNKEKAEANLAMWAKPMPIEKARVMAGYLHCNVTENNGIRYSAWDVLRADGDRYENCPAWTVEQVAAKIKDIYEGYLPRLNRWIAHYENRIAYEKALLCESGYVAPPKAPTKALLPLLNYKEEGYEVRNRYGRENMVYGCQEMTKAEFADINKDYKGSVISADGTHRLRSVYRKGTLAVAFLTDSKVHPKPGAGPIEGAAAEMVAAKINKAQAKIERMRDARNAAIEHNKDLNKIEPSGIEPIDRAPLEAAKAALKAGVQIAVAPQLFPTPPELAARMVELAGIEAGHFVLEPSAGTGRLLEALPAGCAVVAVEINPRLFSALPDDIVTCCGDFLDVDLDGMRSMVPALGDGFNAIVMNPPFANADDIKHIKHAATMLRPGGTLVAICAGGPRQKEQLEPLAALWEPLPPGTFKDAGTSVNTVLLTIER